MNITDKNTSASSVTDHAILPLLSYTDDEIKARYCFLVTQPLDLIMSDWLNEVVKGREAIGFIQQKGLTGDFARFKKTYPDRELITTPAGII